MDKGMQAAIAKAEQEARLRKMVDEAREVQAKNHLEMRTCTGEPDCICDSCCERRYRQQERETEGYTVANQITDYVNRSMQSPEPFVHGMHRQHRTLQQGFTGLCIAWLEHLARLKDGEFDARNQASVEFARKLVVSEAWKDKYLPYI